MAVVMTDLLLRRVSESRPAGAYGKPYPRRHLSLFAARWTPRIMVTAWSAQTRMALFAETFGKENVIAGTDCGMGYRVHPQIAWAKLKALGEGARLASQTLWSR
jgi:hypothetical protein